MTDQNKGRPEESIVSDKGGDREGDELEDAHAHADPARNACKEGRFSGDQNGGQSSHSEKGTDRQDDADRANIDQVDKGAGVPEKDKNL